MADLVVFVPTRGRPHAVSQLARAFDETCTADTRLVFVVDEDDPDRERYEVRFAGANLAVESAQARPLHLGLGLATNAAHTMVGALNEAAHYEVAVFGEPPFAVGFMGDDHRPRTRGWDTAYLDALRAAGTGIVYGNDLLQRHNLPTQCAMTADIVRSLGWMAPPVLRHMYVDNFWLDLGRAADCITYLPNTVVEHMHPVAGKAAVDDGYARVNAAEVYTADEAAYRQFVEGGLLRAAADTVLALRSVRS